MVSVELAGALSRVTGKKKLSLEASSLLQALESLTKSFGSEFRDRLFDETGKPRRFINIYVNGRDYRFLEKLDTRLQEGDVVSIIPAVSGG